MADSSYMGTYGIAGIWTGWLLSRGASHLVAESAASLHRAEIASLCRCNKRMVRRPGAWKCYRHPKPVVIEIKERFPRSPRVSVLPGDSK